MSGFNVGDRVRNVGYHDPRCPIGSLGTVIDVTEPPYPLLVLFDTDPLQGGSLVDEEEVELFVEENQPTAEGSSEVLATDPKTGGQKGRKPEEYALIPPFALAEVARVYGMGAQKYDSWNWAKGYPYSWALSALYRHVEAFRRGENTDSESGLSHLAHAAFHLFTLMEFEEHSLGTDDRWRP